LTRDPVIVVCALIILLMASAAIFAPWLGLADPYQGGMVRRLRPIGTAGYPLGTDELGRDMLTRLIYGGRLSLFIGLFPVALAFVDAARASGAGPMTIMRVHVLGNVLGPIFVYAASLISVCMILGAGLSFLGLGTKPPEPEWGLMLNTLRTAIYLNPWVAALPGAMIFAVSICFNLLSDGLRSAMDIRN